MAMTTRNEYSAEQLAVLVPTKDRPDSVCALLESLATQTYRPGRVVIAATGQSIEEQISAFSDRLVIEYIHCERPGQIHQRKTGLAALGTEVRLVAFLDDKITLEPDAMEAMIDCWNRVEPETAGIGFNIVNMPPSEPSPVYHHFGVGGIRPGTVSRSGYNALFLTIEDDIRTQWLGGGYTVWRKDILDRYPQQEVQTRWAAGEDLRFSYPIGLKHPLWACAGARLRNVTIRDQAPDGDVVTYRGKVIACHELYFSYSQPGISFPAGLWMVLGLIGIDAFCGWRYGNREQRLTAQGRFQGLIRFFKVLFSNEPLETVLND